MAGDLGGPGSVDGRNRRRTLEPPPNDFEALYTSLDENGAIAEIYYHLTKAPVFTSSAVNLFKLPVRTEHTLVFDTVDALERVGVEEEAFRRGNYARTCEIGAAACFLDAEGLIVPSARWNCSNLILFPDRMLDLETLSVEEIFVVNWPAWRKKTSS